MLLHDFRTRGCGNLVACPTGSNFSSSLRRRGVGRGLSLGIGKSGWRKPRDGEFSRTT